MENVYDKLLDISTMLVFPLDTSKRDSAYKKCLCGGQIFHLSFLLQAALTNVQTFRLWHIWYTVSLLYFRQ